ncbi:unnamed protein product, partial [marine sediment metagenome]
VSLHSLSKHGAHNVPSARRIAVGAHTGFSNTVIYSWETGIRR